MSDVLHLDIDAAAVRFSAPEDERADRPLLLLLHGYGSHEEDLFSLVDSLPKSPVIASLRAPIAEAGGFAWFSHTTSGDGGPRSDDANAAVDGVLRWLDAEPTLTAVTSVGLLGFSQGGAMVLQLVRRAPTRFAFGVQLAGYVVAGTEPGDEDLESIRPPVFWGRGTRDSMIGPEAVARTAAWLSDHATADIRSYEGLEHAISAEELTDVVRFVTPLIPKHR